ncbi:MAG: M16 family metallopeptidase, partial [Vicinamibacteria bacterium]
MRPKATAIVLLCTAALASGSLAAPAIPAHPKDLRYGPLKFEVPKADQYRFKLKNGIVAYVAEDHALPLATISVTLRAGSFIEPVEKTGLASLTGSMMREGGTVTLTAEQFDEKADFLAANISSFAGETEAGASLNCVSSVLDQALDLFFEMLSSPRFQQDRLDVEKGNVLEDMKQRNDDAGRILGREWRWLMYGREHFITRAQTKSNLDSMTRADLIDFHRKYWLPRNMIFAISGDVRTKDVLAALDRRFADWKPPASPAAPAAKLPWPPPAPAFTPKPGIYHVEKDIPQGKVYIGHPGSRWDRWDNPDNFALMVMNDILGAGGFTSRITKKVRSDEGLAYSAGSSFGIGIWWPGDFRISFQSKNPTVALAAKLSLAEARKLRVETVSDEELTVSKNSFIDSFPRSFESPRQIAGTFASDDYIGRPHSY